MGFVRQVCFVEFFSFFICYACETEMAKVRQESQCEVTYSEGEDSVNALRWEPLSRLLKVNKRYCQQNHREA